MSVVGYLRQSVLSRRFNAHVFYEEFAERSPVALDFQLSSKSNSIFSGEVYSTSMRLREASAIAVAAGLSLSRTAVDASPKSITRGVVELLHGMAVQELLPPDVKVAVDGKSLVSSIGTYVVRYRLDPLGIEVLSVAVDREHGPALIVRVPDNEAEIRDGDVGVESIAWRTSGYFMSGRLEGAAIPNAFAVQSEMLRAGWSREKFTESRVQ
jgi:hypothetical protein